MAALDNLVKLATVQPHAPALRAVVYFDTLALHHLQIITIKGTLHLSILQALLYCLRPARTII
jgi:hypothetical protein